MAGRLVAYVHVGGVVYAPGDVPSAEVAAKITNPACWEGGVPQQGAATDPQPVSDTSPYERMTVSELAAESSLRNEGRAKADRLPIRGRAAIVAALVADDAK